MLGHEELSELEDALSDELSEHLTEILVNLNRAGKLNDFLELIGLQSLLLKDSGYAVHKNGKIIVIGQSAVKAEVLAAIAKDLKLDKSRFEFYLDYEAAKKFDFKKMQWQPSYSAILVGPMPHSGAAKGDYSSVISAIETGEGFPPVVRLGTNALKITKSDFRTKLQELIETKKIA